VAGRTVSQTPTAASRFQIARARRARRLARHASSGVTGRDPHSRWPFQRRAVGVERRPYTVASHARHVHVVCPPPWPRQATCPTRLDSGQSRLETSNQGPTKLASSAELAAKSSIADRCSGYHDQPVAALI
jgi:hypothetical protein